MLFIQLTYRERVKFEPDYETIFSNFFEFFWSVKFTLLNKNSKKSNYLFLKMLVSELHIEGTIFWSLVGKNLKNVTVEVEKWNFPLLFDEKNLLNKKNFIFCLALVCVQWLNWSWRLGISDEFFGICGLFWTSTFLIITENLTRILSHVRKQKKSILTEWFCRKWKVTNINESWRDFFFINGLQITERVALSTTKPTSFRDFNYLSLRTICYQPFITESYRRTSFNLFISNYHKKLNTHSTFARKAK